MQTARAATFGAGFRVPERPFSLSAANERFGGWAEAPENVTEITDRWRPYRMRALVLLHVWFRNEAGGPLRRQR